jgi:hypothetical protein
MNYPTLPKIIKKKKRRQKVINNNNNNNNILLLMISPTPTTLPHVHYSSPPLFIFLFLSIQLKLTNHPESSLLPTSLYFLSFFLFLTFL